MNELMIIGRIGELIDHLLTDNAPLRTTNFGSDCCRQLLERDRFFHNPVSAFSKLLDRPLRPDCHPSRNLTLGGPLPDVVTLADKGKAMGDGEQFAAALYTVAVEALGEDAADGRDE